MALSRNSQLLMKIILRYFMVLIPILGILDAGYLAWQHYGNVLVVCPAYFTFIDCGQVLHSTYAILFGVPLAVWGLLFYCAETALVLYIVFTDRRTEKQLVLASSVGGFVFSLYLVYLQIVVIGAICLYCMASAVISTVFFIVVQILYKKELRDLVAGSIKYFRKS
jgi:uncharacterized membrane protein